LRVAGNLSYGYDLLKPAQRKFAFDDIVDLLKLNDLLQRRPHQLSGGEAQRVALGRALLSSPDLLLLDEPLSSLDQHLKQQILPYFNQIKQQTGLAMLYVSHDEAEVHQISDQVVRLEQGRLIS
jgi:molybdate transport system ATP-binding protein